MSNLTRLTRTSLANPFFFGSGESLAAPSDSELEVDELSQRKR